MSFSVVLQRNRSETYALDKTLVDISTVTGSLKDRTSIIDPVIVFELDLTNFVNCNYITISTFGRSYFVTDIKSIRTDLVEMSCHVDVLSSFKDQIRQNTAIIHKNTYEWNLYLNDGTFKVYQNPQVVTKAFPSGFSTYSYVLAVAGPYS